ncbi:hypothetical protein FQA39_LY16204 [Lamprigera yunnana]|nr:hypothetical protein FQA39_LY16204 [Lamprigera yunnana]
MPMVPTSKPSTSGMRMSSNATFTEDSEDEKELSSSSEQQNVSKSPKRKKYAHQQQYTRKWEAEFKWCDALKLNNSLAYCKVCNKEIKGNRTHLKRHVENNKHKNNMSQKRNVVPIDKVIKKINLKNDLQVKISELKLAAFVAEHDLSFKVMEHLPHLIKTGYRTRRGEKYLPSVSGAKPIKKWVYFDSLMFLEPYMTERNTSTNLKKVSNNTTNRSPCNNVSSQSYAKAYMLNDDGILVSDEAEESDQNTEEYNSQTNPHVDDETYSPSTFNTMWKLRRIGSKTLMFEMIEEKKILRIEDMCGNEVYLGWESVSEVWSLELVLSYR